MKNIIRICITLVATLQLATTFAASIDDEVAYCGEEGIWLEILGGGGPELNDGQGGPSYLIWIDGAARILVDTAPGSSVRYDQSDAKFDDLDAILLTHLHVDHSADLPAFIKGSYFTDRTRLLPLFGPDGNDGYPATSVFVERLIGKNGAYPYLAGYLTTRNDEYKLSVRDVPATGKRRWARYSNERFKLSATPVHHGPVPAIAWRIEFANKQSMVFTGDFNNSKNVISEFAKNTDALVVSHAVPEGARGTASDLHATPTQLGRIAAVAEPRMLILGHRMSRTRGRESQSTKAIEAHYNGSLVFANDLECWGL